MHVVFFFCCIDLVVFCLVFLFILFFVGVFMCSGVGLVCVFAFVVCWAFFSSGWEGEADLFVCLNIPPFLNARQCVLNRILQS